LEHLKKPEEAVQKYLESQAIIKIYKKNKCESTSVNVETIERTLEIQIEKLNGSKLGDLYY
jgi:hypothetical protein